MLPGTTTTAGGGGHLGGNRLLNAVAAQPGPVVGLAVAVAYLLLAQYVIWLNDPVNAGAGYWPAAGLTFAAVLLVPRRQWAWIAGAIVTAEILSSSLHGYPLSACAWWAAGNAVEPFTAVLLLRRFGRSGRFAPLRELAWFFLAAVIAGPLIGALVGSIGTATSFDREWTEIVVRWWIGDGLGVLVVAPLVLAWREAPDRRRSKVEVGALGWAVLVVPLLAFQTWRSEWDLVLPYLVLPLMMWGSVRFGVRGAALTGFAVAQVANIATALGYGPFHAAAETNDERLAVLQVFLAAGLSAGLVIAALVSDALRAARVSARDRSAAQALQEAVLPEHLPAVPGVEFAARYVPTQNDAPIDIGGDWYDAFRARSGATAFVIGDIAGHDLAAAVAMAQVRNGLHSLLMESEDPALALAAMDRQLTVEGPIATAICAVYADGRLTWANAGHPPLLLRTGSGVVRYLDDDEPSPLLGAGVGGGGYTSRSLTLEAGDTVIAYTDGLVEHRGWTLDEALSHLAGIVAGSESLDLAQLSDVLLDGGLGGRSRDDDTCLLIMRVTGETTT
jgi:integral membrane sensor domain MASE1